MLRFLSVATLVMVLICLAISASIALANAHMSPDAPTIGAIDHPLSAIDIYEFDFAVEAETAPHPEFEEPNTFQDI